MKIEKTVFIGTTEQAQIVVENAERGEKTLSVSIDEETLSEEKVKERFTLLILAANQSYSLVPENITDNVEFLRDLSYEYRRIKAGVEISHSRPPGQRKTGDDTLVKSLQTAIRAAVADFIVAEAKADNGMSVAPDITVESLMEQTGRKLPVPKHPFYKEYGGQRTIRARYPVKIDEDESSGAAAALSAALRRNSLYTPVSEPKGPSPAKKLPEVKMNSVTCIGENGELDVRRMRGNLLCEAIVISAKIFSEESVKELTLSAAWFLNRPNPPDAFACQNPDTEPRMRSDIPSRLEFIAARPPEGTDLSAFIRDITTKIESFRSASKARALETWMFASVDKDADHSETMRYAMRQTARALRTETQAVSEMIEPGTSVRLDDFIVTYSPQRSRGQTDGEEAGDGINGKETDD